MKRVGFTVIVLTFAVVSAASAQERAAGAARVEVSAFPGGGTFFTKGSDGTEAKFKNYALGASAMVNFNRFIGAEAEVGGGLGVKQTLTINDVSFTDMESPNTLAYNGNVVYNPAGSDRGVIPYATVGIGGLTLFARDELQPLGLTSNETFLSENVGGGVRWYPGKHWGVRGDYRFIGAEAEVGGGLGVKQTLHVNDVPIVNQESPNTLAYNGNIVYNPGGSDRAVIPYATVGIGGMTLFSRTELEPLGLTTNETYLAENVGGGLRWYPSKHWGVRGDYRFIVVNSKNDAGSFFGLDETRYGHRVFGSVLFTFGE